MMSSVDDETLQRTNPLDIDGKNFDCEIYLSKLLKEKNLNSLIQTEHEIHKEVHNLDSEMQTLVYENYNKFISATDTIRKMKTDFAKMEEQVGRLTKNMDKIEQYSTKVSEGLNHRRDDMLRLVKTSGTLKQMEFVFKVPATLQMLVQQKEYNSAIKAYKKAVDFINKFDNIPAFGNIINECDIIIGDLKEHLKDSFRENLITSEITPILLGQFSKAIHLRNLIFALNLTTLSAKEMSTNLALLMQLGEKPGNLAEEFVEHSFKNLNSELDSLQTSCEQDPTDVFQFIDSECSTFLSNVGLMIASCRDLFPNIEMSLDDKVDYLLKKLLNCIENRFVAENQRNADIDASVLTSSVNGIDCVLITRALDRFYRRIQATVRMIPQSISKDLDSKSQGFGTYEKLAYQIVVNVCRLQIISASDFVKKRFELCLTEIRQRLALIKNMTRTALTINVSKTAAANVQSTAASADEPANQSLPDLLSKLERSVVHDLKSSLASLLQMTTHDLSFVGGQNSKFIFKIGFYVREKLICAFFDHVALLCRTIGSTNLQQQQNSSLKTSNPTLILLLSKFCYNLHQSTVGYLLDLCEQQFRIVDFVKHAHNNMKDKECVIGLTSKHLEEKLKNEAQFLIDQYVIREGFSLSQMLVKSSETRDWLGCVEPKSVRAVMKRIVEDLITIDWTVGQFFEEGKRADKSSESSRRTSGLQSFGQASTLKPLSKFKFSSSQTGSPREYADTTLSSTLGRLWTEKVEYFSSVQFNRLSVTSGIVKICLKTLLESVRLKTLGKFGLQQMQVDCRYLQALLWRFVQDEKIVDNLLDEILSSALNRCIDVQLMEASVIDLICEMFIQSMTSNSIVETILPVVSIFNDKFVALAGSLPSTFGTLTEFSNPKVEVMINGNCGNEQKSYTIYLLLRSFTIISNRSAVWKFTVIYTSTISHVEKVYSNQRQMATRGRGRARISRDVSTSSSTSTDTSAAQRPPGFNVNLPTAAPEKSIEEGINSMTVSSAYHSSGDQSTSSHSFTESGLSRSISQYALGQRKPIRRSPMPKECPPMCKLPMRRDFGTRGDKINLLTNHFEIKMPEESTFHHYNVSIIEENTHSDSVEWTGGCVPKHTGDEIRDICYQVFSEWSRKFGQDFFAFVYDRQQHIYSCVYIGRQMEEKVTAFVDRKFKICLSLNSESPEIKVSMNEIKRVLFNGGQYDRSPMQVLDLLHNQMLFLNRLLKKSDYVPHGRCFYHSAPGSSIPLQFGRELKDGFIKSIRSSEKRSSYSIYHTLKAIYVAKDQFPCSFHEVSRKVAFRLDIFYPPCKKSPFFIEQRLDKTASEILRMSSYQDVLRQKGLTPHQTDLLRGQFRDLRIRTLHNGKIFVISNVSDKPATKQMFVSKDGASISVATYFADIGHPLQFAELPCVRDQHNHYYPLEKCWILPNQKVELKKLTVDPNVSSIIIKESAVAPDVRMRDILKKSDDISGEHDEFLAKMNIQRDKQMMRVQGRVLQPPALKFGNRRVQVIDGGWQLRGTQLLNPAAVKSFVVVCLDRSTNLGILESFVDRLIGQAIKMGMKVPKTYPKIQLIKGDEFLSYIDEQKRINDIKLAICVLDPKTSGKQRADIKYHEKDTEVVTQCLNAQTILKGQRGNEMMFENIVLKLNAKCGGLNNDVVNDNITTEWFDNKTMFLGMDVNHPPPLSKREIAMGCVPMKPSVVGAVANAGVHVHSYIMQARAQDARMEEISQGIMEDITRRFLTKFSQNKGHLPERVILYRDGVSESQFSMVLNKEALAIKNSFVKFRRGYCPKLTVITVQKRHNTRFFREELASRNSRLLNARNAEKNIPAGTVVDTGPVGAFQFDFFMASHSGIQGCTKAANYVVILDENNFSADDLQGLTYALCHVYQRSTKSVSLPAPCYFAHHAATRGKELSEGYLNIGDDAISNYSSLSSGSGNRRDLDFEDINKHLEYSDEFGNRALFL